MAGVMVGDWCLPLFQQFLPVVAHIVDLVADRADSVGIGMRWLDGLGRIFEFEITAMSLLGDCPLNLCSISAACGIRLQ